MHFLVYKDFWMKSKNMFIFVFLILMLMNNVGNNRDRIIISPYARLHTFSREKCGQLDASWAIMGLLNEGINVITLMDYLAAVSTMPKASSKMLKYVWCRVWFNSLTVCVTIACVQNYEVRGGWHVNWQPAYHLTALLLNLFYTRGGQIDPT